MTKLEKVDIIEADCRNCGGATYTLTKDYKALCPSCGDCREPSTNELWAHLEGMKGKMDWEGGMDEVLFNYASSEFFNIGDEKLYNAAKKAEETYRDFQDEWERICKENQVEPYF